MAHDLGHERTARWGERLTLRQAVTLEWESRHRDGTIHHLSMSGCFIETAFPYPVGSTIHLSFQLDPDSAPFITDGKVVTRNLGGIGIRFAYHAEADALRLKEWIDVRLHAPPAAVPDAA